LGRIGLLLVLSVGLAATMFWANEARGLDLERFGLPVLGAGLFFVALLSAPNLALRWFRWHFLLRRAGFRLPARESLLAWVIALPALLTPLAVGELLRSLLLRRRYPGIGAAVGLVWLVERSCDVAVLFTFWAAATERWVVAAVIPVAWLALAPVARLALSGVGAALLRPRPMVATLMATALAWSFPIAAFWVLVARLGPSVGIDLAALVFAKGTLLGGLVGLPLGIGLTGSMFVLELRAAGVGMSVAIAGTALLRAGTAWFSVGFGLLCLLAWRHGVGRLVRPVEGEDHFDAIAGKYPEEIPEHVRARLLERKVDMMRETLEREGVASDAAGLDVGCGQGWYAARMARHGYRMHGIDTAERQVEAAREHARSQGVDVDLRRASAASLPFPDASFDFAYAINVLHHLPEGEQGRAMDEIVRVLRPGGRLFLHEINTRNPLFQFYMGYVFPVLRSIDEGTEQWVRPDRLPDAEGADWNAEVEYFTFLPEFVTARLSRRLRWLEAALERSSFRIFGAHYLARLRKRDAAG
jgi:2-polyprenyl-3-methyl-5-hydroxy-6-metoxy-1,4-benzoquinol methylase